MKAHHLAIICAIAGIAIGFLMRPVVVRKVDTTTEDSLRHEARRWQDIARGYEATANDYRRTLDSLERHPIIVTKRIRTHERTLHSAGLDAIRDSLLTRPD